MDTEVDMAIDGASLMSCSESDAWSEVHRPAHRASPLPPLQRYQIQRAGMR